MILSNRHKVSIIIPVYNDSEMLNKTLSALEKQDYPKDEYEVIVVDNGSTDDSVDVVKKFENVKIVFEHENLSSPYSARNRGIERAEGDIIVLLDATCVPCHGWLKEGINCLCSEEADIVGGKVIFDYGDGISTAKLFDAFTKVNMEKAIKERKAAMTANLFIRRKVFDSTGFFVEGIRSGGDTSWTKKATDSGFKLVFCPEAYVLKPARDLYELLKKQWRVSLGQPYIWAESGTQIGFPDVLLIFLKMLIPRPAFLREITDKCRDEGMQKYLLQLIIIYLILKIISGFANYAAIVKMAFMGRSGDVSSFESAIERNVKIKEEVMLRGNDLKNRPFVSIIIPCYREKDFIAKCLDSLLDNDYPHEKLEILVMDGGSEDGTREIVEEYGKKYPFIFLKDNPGRYPPSALNIGIKNSRGEIIIRCDAHAVYEKGYIRKLTARLTADKSIGNAGGLWINSPASGNAKAKAIAYTLGCKFCVGPNRYRTGVAKASFVDTVPFGAWRREVFDEIGLFNEEFLRAQDLEFNARLTKGGYKVLLDPEIKSCYFPRSSFKKLFRMMCQCGYWKNFVNKKLKIISSSRQLAPPVLLLYLVSLVFLALKSNWFFIPLIAYMLLLIYFSAFVAVKNRDIKIMPLSALTLLVSHTGYGLGYLKGFWDFFIRKKQNPEKSRARLTR